MSAEAVRRWTAAQLADELRAEMARDGTLTEIVDAKLDELKRKAEESDEPDNGD
ncbi:hypothetical protein GOB94_13945 [Granulicella sp. 5B5]|uniref:hypothetical protein n=1 Tax=Granulicella sp. 5B5 TaxID=1617967 RepID=UPI0015F66A5C|nr:hypothetical protein [Granulicella sp. 5B5]QMV19668.1 hypothetical protein GOB94_13945 [Granulicella sp. 5B5]